MGKAGVGVELAIVCGLLVVGILTTDCVTVGIVVYTVTVTRLDKLLVVDITLLGETTSLLRGALLLLGKLTDVDVPGNDCIRLHTCLKTSRAAT